MRTLQREDPPPPQPQPQPQCTNTHNTYSISNHINIPAHLHTMRVSTVCAVCLWIPSKGAHSTYAMLVSESSFFPALMKAGDTAAKQMPCIMRSYKYAFAILVFVFITQEQLAATGCVKLNLWVGGWGGVITFLWQKQGDLFVVRKLKVATRPQSHIVYLIEVDKYLTLLPRGSSLELSVSTYFLCEPKKCP